MGDWSQYEDVRMSDRLPGGGTVRLVIRMHNDQLYLSIERLSSDDTVRAQVGVPRDMLERFTSGVEEVRNLLCGHPKHAPKELDPVFGPSRR